MDDFFRRAELGGELGAGRAEAGAEENGLWAVAPAVEGERIEVIADFGRFGDVAGELRLWLWGGFWWAGTKIDVAE